MKKALGKGREVYTVGESRTEKELERDIDRVSFQRKERVWVLVNVCVCVRALRYTGVG